MFLCDFELLPIHAIKFAEIYITITISLFIYCFAYHLWCIAQLYIYIAIEVLKRDDYL